MEGVVVDERAMSTRAALLLRRLVPVAYASLAFLRVYREFVLLQASEIDAAGNAIPGTAGPDGLREIDAIDEQIAGFEAALSHT